MELAVIWGIAWTWPIVHAFRSFVFWLLCVPVTVHSAGLLYISVAVHSSCLKTIFFWIHKANNLYFSKVISLHPHLWSTKKTSATQLTWKVFTHNPHTSNEKQCSFSSSKTRSTLIIPSSAKWDQEPCPWARLRPHTLAPPVPLLTQVRTPQLTYPQLTSGSPCLWPTTRLSSLRLASSSSSCWGTCEKRLDTGMRHFCKKYQEQ